MELKIRTKLVILLTIIIAVSISMLVYQEYYDKKTNKLYITGLVSEKQFIFNTAISFKQNEIKKHVDDYTLWDEMTAFNLNPDSIWAQEIFTDYIMENFEIDAVYICDTTGKIQFKHVLDESQNIHLPFESAKILSKNNIQSYHFFNTENNRIIEFFGQRTYETIDTGRHKPFGYYIVARVWNKNFINGIEKLSDSKLQILTSEATNNFIVPQNNYLISITELSDFNNNIISKLVVTKDFSNLYSLYNLASINEFVRWGFIVFILVLLIVLLLRWVFIPLQNISHAMQEENPAHLKHLLNRNNEFGQISELFMDFLNHKEELMAINEEIKEKRDRLMHWNKQITDSIFYARRIQKAIFPDKELMRSYFKEYFIYFEPKNIVSGDFYWVKKIENRIYIAAADCTGHGVPGAFMSLLGINFLTEITQRNPKADTGFILNELRTDIKAALNQNILEHKTRDGLNIALCIFDIDKKTMQYSGAYHPLYLFRNDELITLFADKMPVGVHRQESPYKVHEIPVFPNDLVYLYSDGFVDQFGGDANRKYMNHRFISLLKDIHTQSLEKQKRTIQTEFEHWKADKIQIDDVLVFGFRF